MKHSDHGIVTDEQGQQQPADKERAQTVHKSDPKKSVSRESTGDRKADESTPGSGMVPDKDGSAPTG